MNFSFLGRLGIGALIIMVVASVWLWHTLNDMPAALKPERLSVPGVLIDNVRLISMVRGAPEAEDARAVLIMGDRIVEVGAAGAVLAPEGVQVVDGRGFTLIPGLIDAHIHLNDEAELAGYLAHGITGVRNMSGYPFHTRLSGRIEKGDLLGPDFISTGRILNGHGPNENVLQQTVVTSDEAREAVRAQYDAGYQALKVYSNLTKETFDAIVDEAAKLGMTVTGHSPEGVRGPGMPRKQPFDLAWEATLGRGLTTLEHIETIVWHGLRDELDENLMREVAERLAKSGEVVTPTLIAHLRLVLIAETDGAYLNIAGADTINPLTRLFSRDAEAYWSSMDPSQYERPHADFFLAATGLLNEAGVPLIAGTDSGSFGIVPGASLTRELELLVAAGLSPYEALAAATRVSAEALKFPRSGVIAEGYRANLVLVADDPLTHISAIEFPEGVMIGGRWIDQTGLEAMKRSASDTSLVRSLWRVLEMKLFG